MREPAAKWLSGRLSRAAALVYAPGALAFGIDLWLPLNLEAASLYSVGIVMSGWIRSRFHLWLSTILFVAFTFIDLVIGAPSLDPLAPSWVFLVNRSFTACVLLILAGAVHLWIRSMEAVEGYSTGLEHRVRERTRELEVALRQRQEAQEVLYHAQKLEAVGRLTGGVAHEFNNLLTIIGGNASLLREQAPANSATRRLEFILQAADRGARLTRQLLSFSGRQLLNPQVLDLRAAMIDISDMMAHSLGENIAVKLDLSGDLWPVKVDRSELDLAVLNIGLNARDAMATGGRLSVQAHNVSFAAGQDIRHGLLGDFVALTISDSGTGIDPKIVERVFEPFFTTKNVGKGSGLGLSQVYGFATQSGGAVSVESVLGQGTSVTMWLPRGKALASQPVQAPASVVPLKAQAQQVLYVEDNAEVAAVTLDMLAEGGYGACWAKDAREALAVLGSGRSFDVVLTDVVMPGRIDGVELARELRRTAPTLAVLLTSGYSNELNIVGQDGFEMLAKPYNAKQLAEALKQSVARAPRQS
ncbi:MAG TPA: ATP-binding protein [Stellaceae bacterium]|nr:ATP-binding protein [Stellaceae bacterium]